eukprot:667685-Amphidinium_carterae.1
MVHATGTPGTLPVSYEEDLAVPPHTLLDESLLNRYPNWPDAMVAKAHFAVVGNVDIIAMASCVASACSHVCLCPNCTFSSRAQSPPIPAAHAEELTRI